MTGRDISIQNCAHFVITGRHIHKKRQRTEIVHVTVVSEIPPSPSLLEESKVQFPTNSLIYITNTAPKTETETISIMQAIQLTPERCHQTGIITAPNGA